MRLRLVSIVSSLHSRLSTLIVGDGARGEYNEKVLLVLPSIFLVEPYQVERARPGIFITMGSQYWRCRNVNTFLTSF